MVQRFGHEHTSNGRQETVLSLISSVGVTFCMVVMILGIKIKWFRRRLNLNESIHHHSSRLQSIPTEPNDVTQGVFRFRLDEDSFIESPKILPPVQIRNKATTQSQLQLIKGSLKSQSPLLEHSSLPQIENSLIQSSPSNLSQTNYELIELDREVHFKDLNSSPKSPGTKQKKTVTFQTSNNTDSDSGSDFSLEKPSKSARRLTGFHYSTKNFNFSDEDDLDGDGGSLPHYRVGLNIKINEFSQITENISPDSDRSLKFEENHKNSKPKPQPRKFLDSQEKSSFEGVSNFNPRLQDNVKIEYGPMHKTIVQIPHPSPRNHAPSLENKLNTETTNVEKEDDPWSEIRKHRQLTQKLATLQKQPRVPSTVRKPTDVEVIKSSTFRVELLNFGIDERPRTIRDIKKIREAASTNKERGKGIRFNKSDNEGSEAEA